MDRKNAMKKKDQVFINNFKIATGQKRIRSEEKNNIIRKRNEKEEHSRNKESFKRREHPTLMLAQSLDEASNLIMSSNQFLNKNCKAVKKESHKATVKIRSKSVYECKATK